MEPEGKTYLQWSSDPKTLSNECFDGTKETTEAVAAPSNCLLVSQGRLTNSMTISSPTGINTERTQSYPISSRSASYEISECSSVGSHDVSYLYKQSTENISEATSIVGQPKTTYPRSIFIASRSTVLEDDKPDQDTTVRITSRYISSAVSASDDETTLYVCEDVITDTESSGDDRSLGNDSEYNENNSFPVYSTNDFLGTGTEVYNKFIDGKSALLSSIKRQSLVIGFLIGLFIQLSTLGTNFLVLSLKHEIDSKDIQCLNCGEEQNIFRSNFVWSVLVSMMGIGFMNVIRFLLSTPDSSNKEVFITLECFVAAGSLIGVCVAWIAIDVLLRVNAHLLISFFTLAGALLWCRWLTSLLLPALQKNDTENENNYTSNQESHLTEPLIGGVKSETAGTKSHLQQNFQLSGLILGLLVGIFIQFSSLGVNFVIMSFRNWESVDMDTSNHVEGDNMLSPESRSQIIRISFIWSMFTSLIGIIILITIRSMVTKVFLSRNVQERCSNNLTKDQEILILCLECAFAIGATFGLNASWALTDVILGLESHWQDSCLTLLGTIAWCKAVLFFCQRKRVPMTPKSIDKQLKKGQLKSQDGIILIV